MAPALTSKPDLSTTCLPACKVTLPVGSIVRLGPAKMVSQASNVWVELMDWLASSRLRQSASLSVQTSGSLPEPTKLRSSAHCITWRAALTDERLQYA